MVLVFKSGGVEKMWSSKKLQRGDQNSFFCDLNSFHTRCTPAAYFLFQSQLEEVAIEAVEVHACDIVIITNSLPESIWI